MTEKQPNQLEPKPRVSFDHTVSWVLLVTVVLQFITAVYSVGQYSERVEALERTQNTMLGYGERLAKVETELPLIRQTLESIDQKLDREHR